ncbi:MAG: hypothetical protein JW869_01450 [Candidatus Omnitrophica bacterium]|nr:hypothetical protein [Candidatus Omnitrophota bacterium]
MLYKMKPRFYLGLGILLTSEVLLLAGVKWARIFFTPLVWTGYILAIDAVVFKIRGRSRIATDGREFLLITVLSAVYWYVFEFFNLFLKNWAYIGLPAPWITIVGMTWSFATIGPGMLETSDLLESAGAFRLKMKGFKISRSILYTFSILGAGCLISILVTPTNIAGYLAIPLWLGFIFLLDPVNYLKGRSSILGDWQAGNWQRFLCLFVAGLICGFLWEFWNYWAGAKWVYKLPYPAGPKIFEMPLLGFLGFPLLALDYYVFYSYVLKWKEG